MSKTCRSCKIEKPLNCFYRHSQMADGFYNQCKDCKKIAVRKHRFENIEKIRSYDRTRGSRKERILARKEYATTENGKNAIKVAKQNWNLKNKHKKLAHLKVYRALLNKDLFKSDCLVCGSNIVEAHHEDYSKPLDVLWLCDLHHKEIHKQKRTELREKKPH